MAALQAPRVLPLRGNLYNNFSVFLWNCRSANSRMAHAMRRLSQCRSFRRFLAHSRIRESITVQHMGTPDDRQVGAPGLQLTVLPSLAHAKHFCLACSQCSPKSNLTNPRTESWKEHHWKRTDRNFALAIGLGTSLVSFVLLFRWLREDSSLSLLPPVHAISLVGGSHRTQFNFIADVVQGAVPASVFIEIQARHPFSSQPIKLSQGSGFLVRSDGLILTNAHVVRNKTEVVVTLHDGRKFTGHVIGVDQTSDLACVKINASNLPYLRLGNSNSLRPGEWVIAVGSPLSLNNSVTAGIVSSVHRGGKELGIRSDMDYIQTDAQITFGNSGGALINLDGEAVGINTMKITTGISFAIPSDFARNFLSAVEKHLANTGNQTSTRLMSTEGKQHFIGVTMLTLTSRILEQLQERMSSFPSGVSHGVFIHQVAPESPAQKAGLQPGDVIVAINGKEVRTTEEVYSYVGSGKAMQVSVRRGHSTLQVKVVPLPLE